MLFYTHSLQSFYNSSHVLTYLIYYYNNGHNANTLSLSHTSYKNPHTHHYPISPLTPLHQYLDMLPNTYFLTFFKLNLFELLIFTSQTYVNTTHYISLYISLTFICFYIQNDAK